nr:hypothetical protein CFP56_62170 [Quercus suber]
MGYPTPENCGNAKRRLATAEYILALFLERGGGLLYRWLSCGFGVAASSYPRVSRPYGGQGKQTCFKLIDRSSSYVSTTQSPTLAGKGRDSISLPCVNGERQICALFLRQLWVEVMPNSGLATRAFGYLEAGVRWQQVVEAPEISF